MAEKCTDFKRQLWNYFPLKYLMMKLCIFIFFIPGNLPKFLLGTMVYLTVSCLSLSQSTMISHPFLDFFSFSLVMLSVWLSGLMLSANILVKNYKFFKALVKTLMVFLVLSFFTESFLGYYFFFEASLIPIFWIIMSWGYQPERILASLMMFFYTMVSSLPLLVVLFLSWNFHMSLSVGGAFFEQGFFLSGWVMVCFVSAFLVKLPMYLVHLWLPKAHVEAPVSGSMILAGVLLKLGGYGLFRFSNMFCNSETFIFMVIGAWGGSILSILCCRLADAKVIIAYSSVVHMALIIVAIFGGEQISLNGVWWVMLAHGLVSSALFAAANLMYEQSHSRSIILNKGILLFSPAFSLFWFLLIVMNFSGPFTLNLFGELGLIMGTLSVSTIFALPVIFITFFSAGYGLVLYASTQHGNSAFLCHSHVSNSFREMLLLISHMWPILFLLLSLSI